MGEPIKIVDLAKQMIRLSGKEPDRDIAIQFTGTRPGEKLFEEVFHDGETTVETAHDGLLLAAPRVIAIAVLNRQLAPLLKAAVNGDDTNVRRLIKDVIPEYSNKGGN